MLLHPPLLRGILDPMEPQHGNHSHAKDEIEENEVILLEEADGFQTPRLGPDHTEAGQDLDEVDASRRSAANGGMSAEAFIASTSTMPSSPSIRSTFSSLLPGRRNRSYSVNTTQEPMDSSSRLGGLLTTVRSRDRDTSPLIRIRSRENRDAERPRHSEDGARRTWSLARSRSRNPPAIDLSIDQSSTFPTASDRRSPNPIGRTEPVPLVMPTVPERQHSESSNLIRDLPSSQAPLKGRNNRPYAVMSRPQPNGSYRSYPNYTAPRVISDSDQAPVASDTRLRHEEIEDDEIGVLWSAGEAHWGSGGTKMAEWDAGASVRRRWVGPMM